jgi:hypothetical protein
MNTSEPNYIVRQTHFRWDESVSGAVRDEIESEECEMLQTAENRYVRRRKALAEPRVYLFGYGPFDLRTEERSDVWTIRSRRINNASWERLQAHDREFTLVVGKEI